MVENFKNKNTLDKTSIKSSINLEMAAKSKKSRVMHLSEDETWTEVKTKNNKQLINVSKVMAYIELSKTPEFRFRLIVSVLFMVIFAMVISTSYLHERNKLMIAQINRMYFDEDERHLEILDANDQKVLDINLGIQMPKGISPFHCHDYSVHNGSVLCRDWQYRAQFKVTHYIKETLNCYTILWKGYSNDDLKDCIELGQGYWYGIGQSSQTSWPLNKMNQNLTAFVTNHHSDSGHSLQAAIKRYFLSSIGVSITIPLHIPLFFSFNSTEFGEPDNALCLESKVNHYPYLPLKEMAPTLEYQICTDSNLTRLHALAAREWIDPQTHLADEAITKELVPELLFIEKPIWIIDEQMMPNLNQSNLVEYSNKLFNYGIEPGFLLLDSRWETHVGDLEINPESFPDPNKHFEILFRRGFKIILTVTLLMDIYSNIFSTAVLENRLISQPLLNVPLLTTCDETSLHLCAVLNIFNSTTRDWFVQRLSLLTNHSIYGLMFESVQALKLPRPSLNKHWDSVNPDYFQTHVKSIAASSINLIGMDTVADTVGFKGFLRMAKLNSSWDSLKKIIPNVLTLGLIGYPIVNPGSVGGFNHSTSISDELYIRWFELSTFLPIIQLSDIPKTNISTIKIAKKFINIREQQVIPVMKKYMKESLIKRYPLIRPLWWFDSPTRNIFNIDDQFAVGNDIIVAPILHEFQTFRDIYLPNGWWKDEIKGGVIRGNKWMRNYQIEINQVAYFTRIDPNN